VKFELTPDNRGASNQVLLDDLRRAARDLMRDWVSRDEYDQLGRFHSKTLVKRFGSWNKALELAGLRVKKPNNLEKDDCLADLRRVASQLGKPTVTVREYEQLGRFSEGPFLRVFGGWSAALQQAGLVVSAKYHERCSDDELFQNLESVWRVLGRQPKRSDLRPPTSMVGATPYCRRFGSWRQALEAFVDFANHATDNPEDQPSDEAEAQSSESVLPAAQAPKAPRSPSWRLRFLVMRRDGFKCRLCGVSPATSAGVVLEIDHVLPWTKGGETLFENLQTLCQVCNGGKSDLHLDGERLA
jgi:hypothetical protein